MRAEGNFAARHCTRFYRLKVLPSTALDQLAVRVPEDSESADMVCSKFALVHSATRKREFAQTAVLAFSELALVAAVMTIGLLAAPVQLAIAPRTAGSLRAVRIILDAAIAVWLILRVERTHIAAAAGQEQIGTTI